MFLCLHKHVHVRPLFDERAQSLTNHRLRLRRVDVTLQNVLHSEFFTDTEMIKLKFKLDSNPDL